MISFLCNSLQILRPAPALALGLGLFLNSFSAGAEDKPGSVIFATYGLASTAYTQSLVLARMLASTLKTPVRLEPKPNSLARHSALKSGQAGYCICGVTGFFAQEGLSEYAQASWGPQPLRTMLMARGTFGVGVATAKSARIRTLADLKGRNVAWIGNADEANFGMIGALQFAGLSRDQVSWVEFPSMKEASEALQGGKIDAGFMTTTSPYAGALGASGRGIHWPSMPPSNLKGWWRLKSTAPYLAAADPYVIKTSLSGWQGASHPFPILMTTSGQTVEQVYTLTKSIIENYEQFKDGARGADGWHIYAQELSWVIPYHEGAIRYFRELGMWNEENDAYNDGLIYRQQVLQTAWTAYLGTEPEEEKFISGWKAARRDALEQTGLRFQLN